MPAELLKRQRRRSAVAVASPLVQRVVQRLKLALLSLPLLGQADPHLSHFGRIPVVFLRCGGDVR